MVVVTTKSMAWGPFLDANAALEWIERHRANIAILEGPMVISGLISPEHWDAVREARGNG